MPNDYYSRERFLAEVDRNDAVNGPIERWKAHKEGILHRGFTAILIHGGSVLLQHRKHPAFDGVMDLTFSSHPVFTGNILQSDTEAIHEALLREWGLHTGDIDGMPRRLGSVYYNAKDPKSIYTEHEVDAVYMVKVNVLPSPDPEYAYGVESALPDADVIRKKFAGHFAPWVERILETVRF